MSINGEKLDLESRLMQIQAKLVELTQSHDELWCNRKSDIDKTMVRPKSPISGADEALELVIDYLTPTKRISDLITKYSLTSEPRHGVKGSLPTLVCGKCRWCDQPLVATDFTRGCILQIECKHCGHFAKSRSACGCENCNLITQLEQEQREVLGSLEWIKIRQKISKGKLIANGPNDCVGHFEVYKIENRFFIIKEDHRHFPFLSEMNAQDISDLIKDLTASISLHEESIASNEWSCPDMDFSCEKTDLALRKIELLSIKRRFGFKCS